MSGLESGTRPVPLHAKVSNYNMGWSLGSLAGFGLFGALASLPRQAGYFLAAAAFTLVALMLRPRLGFAARLPAASGDRSSLPELPRLTFMSRFNLLLTCVMAVALVSQLEKSFGTDLELDRARRLTGICLTCYSAGFVVMFFVLGRWSGWVLRPWRLLACQSGLLLGATAFALLSFLHGTHGMHGMHGISAAGLAACGLIIGLGYGASYTGSLYYSLRLPAGASSSAGIHETYIGAGNTVGPTLAGLFLQLWGSRGGWPQAGLGLYMLAFALIGLLFQLALIPGIVRLTKRAS
jgi:MFS family permease